MSSPDAPSDIDEDALCVYLDNDGAEIPAEAEASVLMAAATADGEALRPYAEDAAVFESARLQSVSALTAGLAALRVMTTTPSTAMAKAEAPAADREENEEDEGDEWGMMAGPSGSGGWTREATDGDDWVLAEILARRMDRALGVLTYLCKWKYFPENTWETRETLEDEGHKAAVDAADAARQDHLLKKGAAAQKTLPKEQQSKNSGPSVHCLPMRSSLEDAVVRIERRVAQAFASCGYALRFIVPVLPQAREAAFLETWDRLQDTHRPILLFHGTRQHNIPSIVQHSLVVPGTGHGVTVANGSAHGVGIYTAFSPSTSLCYTTLKRVNRHTDAWNTYMFVCLGLVSNSDENVCQTSVATVFFDAKLVIPLWLAHIAGPCQTANSTQREVFPALPRMQYRDFYDEKYGIRRFNVSNPNDNFRIVNPSTNTEKREEREALSEAVDGVQVDAAFVRRPMTKKMVKAAPRYVKDLFRQGKLTMPKK